MIFFCIYTAHIQFHTSHVYSVRHLVTAAHCLCDFQDYDVFHFQTNCRKSSKNQITNDNTIVVSGGSNSALDLDNKRIFEWDIFAAYIIENDNTKHDIGIAELMPDKMFFDSTKLMIQSTSTHLKNAHIIPICLGALNLNKKVDMSNTEIKGVGWGLLYEEIPDPKKLWSDNPDAEDPVYSSCMTSQASPGSWRFQNCDMQKMKKQKNPPTGNIWTCEKTKPPPEYKNDQEERCQNYFIKFGKLIDKIDPTKDLTEKRLNDIDLMYVEDEDGKKIEETCYNPRKLLEHGWCFLKDYPEKYKRKWKGGVAWGICSNSCNSHLMEVKSL